MGPIAGTSGTFAKIRHTVQEIRRRHQAIHCLVAGRMGSRIPAWGEATRPIA